jgi:hypothetical protein
MNGVFSKIGERTENLRRYNEPLLVIQRGYVFKQKYPLQYFGIAGGE